MAQLSIAEFKQLAADNYDSWGANVVKLMQDTDLEQLKAQHGSFENYIRDCERITDFVSDISTLQLKYPYMHYDGIYVCVLGGGDYIVSDNADDFAAKLNDLADYYIENDRDNELRKKLRATYANIRTKAGVTDLLLPIFLSQNKTIGNAMWTMGCNLVLQHGEGTSGARYAASELIRYKDMDWKGILLNRGTSEQSTMLFSRATMPGTTASLMRQLYAELLQQQRPDLKIVLAQVGEQHNPKNYDEVFSETITDDMLAPLVRADYEPLRDFDSEAEHAFYASAIKPQSAMADLVAQHIDGTDSILLQGNIGNYSKWKQFANATRIAAMEDIQARMSECICVLILDSPNFYTILAQRVGCMYEVLTNE